MPSQDPPKLPLACADELRACYPTPRRQRQIALWSIAILIPFFLLVEFLKMEWLGGIGIALWGGFFVLPHLLRIRRFIISLPCGSCGRAAGRHITVSGVLHLHCNHCGHLTRTDCLMLGPGKPTKI